MGRESASTTLAFVGSSPAVVRAQVVPSFVVSPPRYSIAYFVILAASAVVFPYFFVAFTIKVLGHAMALRGGMRTAPVAPLSMKAGGSDLESMCKQKISSNKAMIFSKSSCPFCLKAKKARKARRWHCFARDSSKTLIGT